MGKNPALYGVWLLLIVLIFSNLLFSQMNILSGKKAAMQISFNIPPDSLFIDDHLVNYQDSMLYPCKAPSTYLIRAVKKGYEPLEVVFKVKVNRVYMVKRKLRELESHRRKRILNYMKYKFMPIFNLGTISGLTIIMLSSSTSKNNSLPAFGLTTVSHVFWGILLYRHLDRRKNSFQKIESVNIPITPVLTYSTFFHAKKYPGVNQIERYVKKNGTSYGPRVHDVVSSFSVENVNGFSLGLHHKIFHFLSTSISFQYYPSMNFQTNVKDSLVSGAIPTSVNSTFKNTGPLSIINWNINFKLIEFFQQKLMMSAGRTFSNTIQNKNHYLVKVELPYLPTIYDTATVSYKFNATGYNTGIEIVSPINNSISINFSFKYVFGIKIKINGIEQKYNFQNWQIGLQYGF